MTKQQLIAIFFAMIITSALVSAATVVGGLWFLKQSGSETESKDLFADSPLAFLTQPPAPSRTPSFHELDKIVLSVKGKRQTHFVMLEVAVETRRPERIESIDDYMPIVRNSLLKLFSDKTYDDLRQDGAVNQLQNQVKQTVLLALENTDIVAEIDDVLLTKYVVQ
ncbi:flagellar basal body-associated FliL family protein [Vibrio brasiliensis]|jgi:flagellar FliL protein|uniref:Flagellar protein FliL n=1 Tax=Vibrio brasiliensis LMG 20546 TaxID=945543 RepID=E8LU44_9VIBR|nr:flagellar basal body-associated FliL family protein [Vibrio brasiliensis]EGA65709.1 flagellar biosynthesis protein FliL [Vibrio brasiliensis LMG 20546]MCG9647012.1 flagellar basal body-associated FliL family protein [Vibrio brasiliensis]MCG9725924.1 flagellar basal body-associated FliL family protein [Vibrio brasiliensis]MCG9751419.1 flagellar basal body-associated FliL family protein [Vibrio brasiliensis]MCG9781170.1 flagellar basal body-associated FliL family protein [Vibrio brasiliensis]